MTCFEMKFTCCVTWNGTALPAARQSVLNAPRYRMPNRCSIALDSTYSSVLIIIAPRAWRVDTTEQAHRGIDFDFAEFWKIDQYKLASIGQLAGANLARTIG